jgi:integrase/recombinase XerD
MQIVCTMETDNEKDWTEFMENVKRSKAKEKLQKEAEKEAFKGTLDQYEAYKLLMQRKHYAEEVGMIPLKELQKTANSYYRNGKDHRGKPIKKSGATYICTNGVQGIGNTFECNKDYIPEKRNQVVFKFVSDSSITTELHHWSPTKGTRLVNSGVNVETVESKNITDNNKLSAAKIEDVSFEPLHQIKAEDKIDKVFDTYSQGKVTAAIYWDCRRAKKDSEKYPVKFRVTLGRKQLYYSSGIDLTEEQWIRLPKAKDADLKEQRVLIQDGFENVKSHIKELFKSEDGFSLEALNARLGKGKRNSIIAAFEARIKQLRKDNKFGTADWYMYSQRSFMKFTGKDMKFSEITADWLKRYEAHMVKNDKSYTTISMFQRALQVIVNEGRKKGYITNQQYPYGKYQIPESEGRKMALTLSQIGEILKYPLTNRNSRMSRDLWYFSYLCQGINIIDLCHLKYSNIKNGEIRWYRIKTLNRSKHKREIAATLLPEMQKIIDEWGNKEGYIFPILSEGLSAKEEMRLVKKMTTVINIRMSNIGKKLGYGNVSTYTARHSYATVSKRAGVNIAYISESLGHSNVEITETYLDSFESDERLKNAKKLIPQE